MCSGVTESGLSSLQVVETCSVTLYVIACACGELVLGLNKTLLLTMNNKSLLFFYMGIPILQDAKLHFRFPCGSILLNEFGFSVSFLSAWLGLVSLWSKRLVSLPVILHCWQQNHTFDVVLFRRG